MKKLDITNIGKVWFIVMEFKDITLQDREWLDKKFKEDDRRACEFCFANNYLWKKIYPTQVAKFDECGILRFLSEDDVSYVFPLGSGDKKKAIEKIMLYEQANGGKVRFYGLMKEEAALLEKWFPKRFEISSDRDMYDYIYTTEHLSKLAGKKYHGKRNHIARFKDDNDWQYEKLSNDNVQECIHMNHVWKKKRADKWDDLMQDEYDVVNQALTCYQDLGLVGGVLKKAGEVVAFTIGEPLNSDTFVVHFEKAFPEVQGAYPMINQQFVLAECQEYEYVNREEDDGEEGLRKAKLSYHPDILLEKYMAVQI